MSNDASGANISIVDSYIRNQTSYLQGSIVHADQKATFLLAILGILLGYLEKSQPLFVRGVALAQWNGWESVAAGVSLFAAILLVISGCCAGCVVWPRYDVRSSHHTASFVGIATDFASPDEFSKDMLGRSASDLVERQLRSHHYRCQVCLRKWRLLKRAYMFSATGFGVLIVYCAINVIHGMR